MDPLLDQLCRDGVVNSAEARLVPLTGGVSSEIYRVEDGPRTFVVKRALAKLRVQADWQADTSRNRFERLYLERVAQIVPGAVPRLLASGEGYFAMEWLGGKWENWKTRLLAGCCRPEDAALAGRILGRIHAATAGDAALQREFDTTENFHQLRLEPYLRAVAQKHPAQAALIEGEIARIAATRECLVHGDFSPKNLLLDGERLVVLDCEVAWYGDPAFDLAFLLNHLLLKALYHAPADKGLSALFTAACEAYFGERKRVQSDATVQAERGVYAASGSVSSDTPPGPEIADLPALKRPEGRAPLEVAQRAQRPFADASAFDTRTARVLLLLLWARVDGKSPVEYLPPIKQEQVRRFVLRQLAGPATSLGEIQEQWFRL